MSAKKSGKTEGDPAPERSQVIRLRKGQAHVLAEIAEKFSTTQGQLVSWAVDALVAQVKARGGKLTLPFDLTAEPAQVFLNEKVESDLRDPVSYRKREASRSTKQEHKERQ